MATPLPESAQLFSAESETLDQGTVEESFFRPPTKLCFFTPTGDPLVTIHFDGRVDINPMYTMDEAAAAFWKAVRDLGVQGQKAVEDADR